MTDSASTPLESRILLIVDDEPDLAPMFRRFLKRHYAEILEAPDAPQAAAVLATRPVTHLIVDASLPTEAGQTLVEKWRGQWPSVRYVALFTGSSTLKSAELPGVDRVFIKPEGFDELLEELKK